MKWFETRAQRTARMEALEKRVEALEAQAQAVWQARREEEERDARMARQWANFWAYTGDRQPGGAGPAGMG